MKVESKQLWREVPTDALAPYPSLDFASLVIDDVGGKCFAAASRRGRSHFHDGSFRDDSMSSAWIPETGWLIVAISDGAGSAEFSRAGSDIACRHYLAELFSKLASKEVNRKIDCIEDKAFQEKSLKRLLLDVVNHASIKIQEEAAQFEVPVKKYAATFLGYIAKKFGDKWLIVSVGIGDGIIGLIKEDGTVVLLNTPDGGDYACETRFITMPSVWKNPDGHVTSVRVRDFRSLFSMTDGVSDPVFETESGLSDPVRWNRLDADVRWALKFGNPYRDGGGRLLEWLNFYIEGHHDDRTITALLSKGGDRWQIRL